MKSEIRYVREIFKIYNKQGILEHMLRVSPELSVKLVANVAKQNSVAYMHSVRPETSG